jgi:tripartite-type tricarboxylate transporter receptor subunit TctC
MRKPTGQDQLSLGRHRHLTHLAGEMFRMQAGNIDIVHDPYKSAGHSMPDLLAGRVQVAFETLPTTPRT